MKYTYTIAKDSSSLQRNDSYKFKNANLEKAKKVESEETIGLSFFFIKKESQIYLYLEPNLDNVGGGFFVFELQDNEYLEIEKNILLVTEGKILYKFEKKLK